MNVLHKQTNVYFYYPGVFINTVVYFVTIYSVGEFMEQELCNFAGNRMLLIESSAVQPRRVGAERKIS